jgi:hypothetical protein
METILLIIVAILGAALGFSVHVLLNPNASTDDRDSLR